MNHKGHEMWHKRYSDIYNAGTSLGTTFNMLRSNIMFLSLTFL